MLVVQLQLAYPLQISIDVSHEERTFAETHARHFTAQHLQQRVGTAVDATTVNPHGTTMMLVVLASKAVGSCRVVVGRRNMLQTLSNLLSVQSIFFISEICEIVHRKVVIPAQRIVT